MLRFRPHHFFCTLGFEGKGYSEGFVKNFEAIADQLRKQGRSGDEIQIEVVAGSDSICAPCPNRAGEVCTTEEKISALDHAHSEILGIRPGDVLTWGEAKERLASRMSVDAHHSACAACSWRSMGVCEAALRRLTEEKK